MCFPDFIPTSYIDYIYYIIVFCDCISSLRALSNRSLIVGPFELTYKHIKISQRADMLSSHSISISKHIYNTMFIIGMGKS
jgi:hypothetical protein